jgi:copper chaperone CopZ
MKTLILILSILFTSFSSLSAEEHYDITINVKGLVCDFCARSIEKTFNKTKAVESIYVDLDNGLIQLQLKEGKTLSDEKIKKLIKDNGYALESIQRNK